MTWMSDEYERICDLIFYDMFNIIIYNRDNCR